MRNYRDLRVYQRSYALSLRIDAASYLISNRRFPGLASQLRRASAAVPANIVEGTGHSSRKEFARFLQLALASCVEVDHHLQFACDVGAMPANSHAELAREMGEIRRMMAALLRIVRDELSEAEGVDDNKSPNVGAAPPERRELRAPPSAQATREAKLSRNHGRPETS